MNNITFKIASHDLFKKLNRVVFGFLLTLSAVHGVTVEFTERQIEKTAEHELHPTAAHWYLFILYFGKSKEVCVYKQ